MTNDLVTVQPTAVLEREDDLPDLDDREAAFVDYYLGEASFNAARAASLCGASDASKRKIGWRLVHRPNVRAHIEAHLDNIGVNRARILAELVDVAFADWRDFTEVKMRHGVVVDARMDRGPKIEALKLLGQEMSMFSDKLKIDLTVVPLRLLGVDIDNDL